MRTRKIPITLLVFCLFAGHLYNCEEARNREKRKFIGLTSNKHRDDAIAKKYDTNFHDTEDKWKIRFFKDSGYLGYSKDDDNENDGTIAYRNNRAIDAPGTSEGNSGKVAHQSTPSNLPKENVKPSETVPRKSSKNQENVTITDGICDNIDIRNYLYNFDVLKDCEVIEGFLQIVLIEKISEEDYHNLSFPKLREITDYFLLYRVHNLKSLSKLFPNLEVIRGDVLMADYSLAIYEMPNLQEIGLSKLTKLSRGGVRIESNPSLCYTSTVNWDAIAIPGGNFIKDNSNEASCPVCSHCESGHCWNAKHCQKIEKKQCHNQCLGECQGRNDTDCFVCKKFRHNGKCIEECPDHLYSYRSRRCITEDECHDMNNRNHRLNDDVIWRPFNGSCLTQCPPGYEDSVDIKNNMTMCAVCDGRCRKIGRGAIIRHISDAQVFRGTTVIKGALEFQIRNGNPNIVNELTDAFGMVEEITEYLKITHSFPITTLSFFKNLRLIKGEKLDINNASLVVLDNPNLSSLFDDTQQISIQNGRFFFHYNPKLCLSKIERLRKMVGIANFTDLEVQPASNGEKVACNIFNITIHMNEISPNFANLTWDVFVPNAGQPLLGYLLHYIETENENISYEGNSCGRQNNNTWEIIDVAIPRKENLDKKMFFVLNNLKPYTKYGVFVKTLEARNNNSLINPTGQSRIIFFRTQSDVPTVATDLSSFPVSDTEIIVKWGPPEHPNGPIYYYMISGFIRAEDEFLLETRDYCEYPLLSVIETEEPVTETNVKTTITNDEQSCCLKDDEISKSTSTKKFEIYCHDNMTISSELSPSGRKNHCQTYRYNIANPIFYSLDDNQLSSRSSTRHYTTKNAHSDIIMDDRRTRIYNGIYYSFVHNVSVNQSSYLLKKLRHYSLYTISVAACGRKFANGTEMCSSIQYTNSRTKKRSIADNIDNVKVNVINDTIVTVMWDTPKDPNGLTIAYNVEYTNLIVKDAKKRIECLSANSRREKRSSYNIRNLSPGKYSVRVRSVSLAGDGEFSKFVDFNIGIKDDNTIAIAVSLIFCFFITFIIVFYLFYRNQQRKKQQERLIASVNPDYIETTYIRDHWEVPRENIEILEELGLGNFGMVYRGILDGTMQVAIKTIVDNSGVREKNEFLNEASVMKNFSTFHIIRLLGVVSEGIPPYVIMELMENGDLKTYLRKIRETHLVPDVTRVIRMAGEIADGMAYLESKKFVHRDLAARNCMVSRDLVCKIGDFGMARDIYETDYYKIGKKGLLPIRWMAPENLSDGVFTSDSDVWSFGVVLYEILTLAEIPYQGFSNEEVLNYVLRKGTVNIPRNCPELIVKLMEKCFKWRPSDRPTFMEIIAELEPFLSQDFCVESFYHSEEGVEVRNLGLKKVYHHAAPIRFHWGNETARWVKEFEDNVTLLDQTKAGTSRGRIFKNGFQHFGTVTTMEDVPLDR